MNMEEVFQFSCLKTVEPVIVAGEQGSGKTTLEVMMYRLFQEGKNDLLMFAGSITMKGLSVYLKYMTLCLCGAIMLRIIDSD